MKFHDVAALRAAVAGVPSRPWQGEVHHHGPPDRPLVATLATARRAARYHDIGSPAPWYSSLEEKALAAELERHLPVDVDLGHVLRRVGRARVDVRLLALVDRDVQRALGIDEAVLTQDDQRVCRALGEAANAAGHHGLLAPSAAMPGGTTLVVFRRHLHRVTELVSSVVPVLGGSK